MKFKKLTHLAFVLSLLMFSIDAIAQNTGNLLVHILTSDGKSASGVEVKIDNKVNAITNSEGIAQFKKLSIGEHTITVNLIDANIVERKTNITASSTNEIEIRLNTNDQQLQEVIVNTKRKGTIGSDVVAKIPLSNVENAQSYTTISKELMTQQMVFNVSDALQNAPGVAQLWESVGRAGIGGAYYAQRGFVTQPRARNGVSGNAISEIDASSIERVEVIKGPSATLFGNNISSYGGLINIVTKKPFSYKAGTIQYAGGGYGFNRLSVDYNTPLDSAGKVLFRLNGAYNKQHTFQDNGYKKSYYVAPSLTYQINDRLSLSLDAEFQSSENAGGSTIIYFLPPSQFTSTISSMLSGAGMSDAQVAAVMAQFPTTAAQAYGANSVDKFNIDYKKAFYSNDILNKFSATNFYATVNYKMSNEWKSQTVVTSNYNSSNGYMPYFYLMPNFLPAFIQGISKGQISVGTPGADYLARMVWKPVGHQSIVEAQQNFIGDFKIGQYRNRFVGGLDFYYNNYAMVYSSPMGKLLGLSYPGAFDITAADGTGANYANFNQNKVDSLFSASTTSQSNYPQVYKTYSAYVNDIFNITDQLLVSAGLRIDRFKNNTYGQTALSPKFGLVYQILPGQVSVFGNYQNGFSNQTGSDFNGKSFKPEQANQWETGVKLSAWNDRISGTISYYNIKVKNMVRTDPDHPNFSVQDANQISKGLEADLTISPVDGLSIIGGYSRNNSKYENSNANIDGLRPVTAGPKNTVNFWGSYAITKGAVKGLGLGFGGNYFSKSYAINSRSDGELFLPSYTILRATVFYDQPKFTISAKLNNIANKHYWIGYTTMNPQMLRQFVGSIAFKF